MDDRIDTPAAAGGGGESVEVRHVRSDQVEKRMRTDPECIEAAGVVADVHADDTHTVLYQELGDPAPDASQDTGEQHAFRLAHASSFRYREESNPNINLRSRPRGDRRATSGLADPRSGPQG